MILSVLITATKKNKLKLDQLLAILLPQIESLEDQIEILLDTGKDEIGAKLNGLIKDAQGKYIWILDDFNLISETAIKDIFQAIESEPDIIGISGMTTMNGLAPYDWSVSIDSETKLSLHSPMKTNLAKLLKFRNRIVNADKIWVKEMLRLSPFILETKIDKPILHKRLEFKRHPQASN